MNQTICDQLDGLVQDYEQQGYVILRGLLSADEILSLREACKRATDEESDQWAMTRIDGLREILLDPRIVDPLKRLLGPNVVFAADATARYDDNKARRHFHVDSHFDDWDYSKPYPAVRLGIYLQDHTRLSGGLKVRPGSHKYGCEDYKHKITLKSMIRHPVEALNRARGLAQLPATVNVPSAAGDVVVWNMRIHHTGYAVRVKGLRQRSFHTVVEDLIPSFLHADSETRCVIFASYGAPSDCFTGLTNLFISREGRKIISPANAQKLEQLAAAAGVIIDWSVFDIKD